MTKGFKIGVQYNQCGGGTHVSRVLCFVKRRMADTVRLKIIRSGDDIYTQRI